MQQFSCRYDHVGLYVCVADDIAAVFYEGNLASALELEGGVAAHCAAVSATPTPVHVSQHPAPLTHECHMNCSVHAYRCLHTILCVCCEKVRAICSGSLLMVMDEVVCFRASHGGFQGASEISCMVCNLSTEQSDAMLPTAYGPTQADRRHARHLVPQGMWMFSQTSLSSARQSAVSLFQHIVVPQCPVKTVR